MFLTRNFPSVRRGLWRAVYNAMHRYVPTDDLIFMNLGYAAEGAPVPPSPISVDHYPRQLYERVVGDVDLRDKQVLEIGCGRGGGAAHVHAKFGSKSFIGLDLARVGIERCQVRHEIPGLTFQVGDATNLPFDAESIDAVINIESSHCYPSRARFLSEVHRVLAPGGHFLFADLVWPHMDGVSLSDLDAMLRASGLELVEHEDITRHVVRARDIMDLDPAYEPTLEGWMPKSMTGTNLKARREGRFSPGTFNYECLADGRASYGRWILRKPGPLDISDRD